MALGSSTFRIERKCNLASDSKPHRLTIAVLSLDPSFVYYTVPGVNAAAYLQCRTKNTSPYPFLPSDKVSVFLDGSFVVTTTMASVSPEEYFVNFLGVDPLVKIKYMPPHVSHLTRGYVFSKTEKRQQDASIIVSNTKSTRCTIVIVDSLPQSSDEKIKVELKAPAPSSLSTRSEFTTMTTEQDVIALVAAQDGAAAAAVGDLVGLCKVTNNIVWVRTIDAGAECAVDFSYVVEWPEGTEIETK